MLFIAYFSVFITLGLAVFSLIIPVINTSGRMIRLYCLLNALIEITGRILIYYSISNAFLYHILIWLEVPILLKYYINKNPSLNKNFIKILLASYLLLFIAYYFLEAGHGLGTYSRFIESLIIISLSLIYYNRELRNPTAQFILKDSDFWFVTGLLFYFGGTLFVSLLVRYFLIMDVEAYRYSWAIQNVLDIIKNLVIVYGFIWYRWAVKS